MKQPNIKMITNVVPMHVVPPDVPSNALSHILAYTYVTLAQRGFDVRIHVIYHNLVPNPKGHVILHLAVFNSGSLLAIIECAKRNFRGRRRKRRCLSFGVPVFLFWDLELLDDLIMSLDCLINVLTP